MTARRWGSARRRRPVVVVVVTAAAAGMMAAAVGFGGAGPAPAVIPATAASAVVASQDYTYALVSSDAAVSTFEDPWQGPGTYSGGSVVGLAADDAAGGYWLATADGGVFAYDAPFHGSAGAAHLDAPVVGIAADPSTGGYWLVAADGGVFAYDAPFHGSAAGRALSAPVVGMAADPATGGYWLAEADGQVLAFDAPTRSTGAIAHWASRVVGITADPTTQGYWLVAADGGVFAYDAPFHGSAAGLRLAAPVVGMTADPTTQGYWLVAADGGVFAYDAPFYGAANVRPPSPVTAVATEPIYAPVPAATPAAQARQLLSYAEVPPGSEPQSSLSGPGFSGPATQPVCNPIVDQPAYWTVPGSPEEVADWLSTHYPDWTGQPGVGTVGDRSGIEDYWLAENIVGPSWNSSDGLAFEVAKTTSGPTGIRADGQVVPPGSQCVSAGSSR